MSDVYRGDTVGKRIARLEVWTRMWLRTLKKNRPLHALYLASHEGGDASVLDAIGVRPEEQLAVDSDSCALTAFQEKWPAVPTHLGDVADVHRPTHQKFTAICLDFCAHLSENILDTVAAVIRNAAHEDSCELAVAYLRGREKSDERGRMAKAPVLGTVMLQEGRGSEARVDYLLQGLNARCMPHGTMIIPAEVITYQSRTSEKMGVPMAYAVLSVISVSRRRRHVERMHRRMLRRDETREIGYKLSKIRKWQTLDLTGVWEERHLREYALSVSADSETVGRALNIDPRTVTAWKAHQTMGTYEKEAP